MPRREYKNIVLDARPDRLDLRDREYRPPLQSLPAEWPSKQFIEIVLPFYAKSKMILDQGKEGACTGYGLAAVINYLLWRETVDFDSIEDIYIENIEKIVVSPRMLYNLARIYDEWDGEDYEGSSCRGAMKGWHRHGVCKKTSWEYSLNEEEYPKKNWSQEAVQNPLGAYYRINKDSVSDMQAAIKEVGAIYCSAVIHTGWWIKEQKKLSIIECSLESIGGHAFAIVGYNGDGFIVQNSWGEKWGHQGFAVMKYKDWIKNGSDAWVAVRGAPMHKGASPHTFSNSSLGAVFDDFEKEISAFKRGIKNRDVEPWSEEEAYQHSLVIGNDGRPKLTMIQAQSADRSAHIICYDNIEKWLKESPDNKKIVIYGHGGLNSEENSINRIKVLAPYFRANGIYPLFVTWRTGFLETITNQIEDKIKDIFKSAGINPSGTKAKNIEKKHRESVDRAIENFAQHIVVKGAWSQMKENAKFASDRAVPGFPQHGKTKPGGMVILAQALETLKKRYNCEIHLAGHSAGAILLGYWMDELTKRKLSVESLTLFAPACTMDFANKHYIKACENKIFSKKKMFIHMMSDERELSDNVSIYKKSFLYLVSRSLESIHKTPHLGMAAAWELSNIKDKDGKFNSIKHKEIEKWVEFAKNQTEKVNYFIYDKSQSKVQTSIKGDYIDLSHGSFDNDINVIEQTIKQIKGVNELTFRVEDLTGF